MDRRNFIKGVIGGGTLGSMSLAALAAEGAPDGGGRRAAIVVSPVDHLQASALAAEIAGALEQAGLRVRRVEIEGTVLRSHAEVSRILDEAGGTRVIGVMDDASALIFQQIAATRGAGSLMWMHHRVADGTVRHCCGVAGRESALAWADDDVRWAQRVVRLYSQAASGTPGMSASLSSDVPTERTDGASRSSSFVSFALNT